MKTTIRPSVRPLTYSRYSRRLVWLEPSTNAPRLAYYRSSRYHKRYSNGGNLSISNYKRALIALLIVASATLVGSSILQNDISAKQNKLHQLELQKTTIEKKLEQTSSDKSKLEKATQDQSKSIQDQQNELKAKDEQINDLNTKLQARIEQKRQLALSATAEAATPQAVSYSGGGDIQGIITAAANEFGVSPSYLLAIARCESTFNPSASNGTHFGLFQFLPSTYAAYAPRAGAGSDYWNPTNNARTAAYMFAHGQAGQWECKG